MNIVAIDTSLGALEIASYNIQKPEEIQRFSDLPKPEYTRFTPARNRPVKIEDLLPEALERISKSVDLVAINLGPGSYTSLRTGLAFLAGWKLGGPTVSFETVGINGLEALEQVSLKQAGQEERNQRIWTTSGVVERKEWDKIPKDKKVLRTLPKEDSYVIIDDKKIAMSSIIAYIGIRKYLKGETVDPSKLQPIYNSKY